VFIECDEVCRQPVPGTQFTKCKVTGFNWSKTDAIRDLSFHECQLNYSDFSYMKYPGIKILGCEAKEVDFTEADLSNADLQNTDFENSRFYNTNCPARIYAERGISTST